MQVRVIFAVWDGEWVHRTKPRMVTAEVRFGAQSLRMTQAQPATRTLCDLDAEPMVLVTWGSAPNNSPDCPDCSRLIIERMTRATA